MDNKDAHSLSPELKARIEDQIKQSVVVYIKGTAQAPMCGFSARMLGIIKALGVDFTAHNILDDDELREGIKIYSDWPTIPQLYIGGQFVGGSDIAAEMLATGELEDTLRQRNIHPRNERS